MIIVRYNFLIKFNNNFFGKHFFSNKKVEIAVTKIIHGMAIANRGALRNPESLDFYEKMKEELK